MKKVHIMSLESPVYLIVGLGRSGLSVALWLKSRGIPFVVWDDGEAQRKIANEKGLGVQNPLEKDFPWSALKAIILSPGIPHNFPQPHPIIQRAKTLKERFDAPLEIISDVEFFIRAYPKARYIAITGTNGKSTTAALIGHLLKVAGIETAVGANFGIPVFELPILSEAGIYVFEVSSYQLETTPSFSPLISVLLNITPDHLDRHGGWEGYKDAKKLIFKNLDNLKAAIIGIDTEASREIYEELKSEASLNLVPISVKDERTSQKLLSPTILKGRHNAQNIAASVAVLEALGVRHSCILEGLRTFPGLVHRQEFVTTWKGITFINDSKGTNVEATAKALGEFEDIYWILGGQAKGDNLLDLEPYFSKIKHVFLIGESMNMFEHVLKGYLPCVRSGILEKAVEQAFCYAQDDLASRSVKNPTILLSPACASWDQFKNFEERGDKFKEYVKKLVK